MDILGQYEKQTPQQPQAPQHTYTDASQDNTPVISLIMRLSRGRIRDARQANFVVVIITVALTIIFLLSIIGLPGSSAPTVPLLRSAHPGINIK